jgi:hypothetical protein
MHEGVSLMSTETKWAETVKPLADKLRLASVFDCEATFNPEGSRAVCELLERMANVCDAAIDLTGERVRYVFRVRYMFYAGLWIGVGIGYWIGKLL